jgi:CRP-like cAMP-binding protein
MKTILIRSAWQGQSDCLACGVRQSVLFADLDEQDFAQIHRPIDDFEFPEGSTLFTQGDASTHGFTIRSGFVKLLYLNPDGSQRVLRVLKQGAFAGLEGLVAPVYGHSAIALSPVRACRIPVATIQELDRNSPRLHQQLLRKWGEALKESEIWFGGLNSGTAEQRVARLILKMATQGPDSKLQSILFRREDMGAMLDLALETVSRQISALRKRDIIRLALATTTIEVVQPDVLKGIADGR